MSPKSLDHTKTGDLRRWPETKQELTNSADKAKSYFNRVLEQLEKHNIITTKDTRILEVGIGTGRLLKYLYEEGYPVAGVDSDPRLSWRNKKLLRGITYKARIEDLPHGEGTFSLVIAEGVFDRTTYNQDQARMVRQIAGVLTPGGIFYAGFHEPDPGRPGVAEALEDNFLLVNPGEFHKIYRRR